MFEKLRAAVGATIDRAYATALDTLRQNQHALDALAAALFSSGYLDRAEIADVLTQTPLRAQATATEPAFPHSQQSKTAQGGLDMAVADTPPLTSPENITP
jgi:hypothetical protein